jgi:1-acyl-sn-glycerol-3-phosphate acyltransferase
MIARLNYLWRLAATGICFTVFGVGGFLLALLVFPLLRFAAGESRLRRIRWATHKSFALFLWFMEVVGVMRMEVVGAEKLRNCRNTLVLANHPTLIDVVAMISLMPMANCVVKQALWKNPLLRGVVRGAAYLSNSDSNSLIDDCSAALLAGDPLLVFPEGTRSRPGEALCFQRGAAYIALRSGVPVLPVLIDCSPSTLTKRERWYHIPPRRFHLRIKVLEPVGTSQWVNPGEVQTIAARKLTRAFESLFTLELRKWKLTP